ncbi:hypothetical protein [Intrasporangium mesophilum]
MTAVGGAPQGSMPLAPQSELPRDDRVLPTTRWLSVLITPFLLVAFVLLYGFPGDTDRLWAWTIRPTVTSMVLASAYLGGAWFFVRVLRERRWAAVANGLVAVTGFATLLAIATVLHWDRFNHGSPAFWIWSALYATAPFLVAGAWWVNRRTARPPAPDEPRLGPAARWGVGAFGAGGLVLGATMFVAPSAVIPVWPWLLTPLTCRVIGAIFVLAGAAVGVLWDARWVRLRLLAEVEAVMVVLMLVAALRAHAQFIAGRPMGWLLLLGALVALAGAIALMVTFRGAPSEPTSGP